MDGSRLPETVRRNKRHSSAHQPRALPQPSPRYAPFASLASSTTRQGCRRPYVRPCGADQRPWASIPLQQAGDLVAAIALGQLQGTIGPLQQVIETAVGGGQG